MHIDIGAIRVGLLLSMLTLLFGIAMGVLFGVNEDGVKGYIAEGVAAHPALHDTRSEDKIWRYAQRAHFHATGVGAFTLAMVLLTGAAPMARKLKVAVSTLIGVGSLYPLAWLSMFLLAPALGRGAAHDALITEIITKLSVGSLLLGMLTLFAYLLVGSGDTSEEGGSAVRA